VVDEMKQVAARAIGKISAKLSKVDNLTRQSHGSNGKIDHLSVHAGVSPQRTLNTHNAICLTDIKSVNALSFNVIYNRDD
jgi:hypothetical protein